MEKEIDLREIIDVIWRGKFLITGITVLFTVAAILYVFFMAPTTYRYSALLDLTSYELDGEEVLALIKQNKVLGRVAAALVTDPAEQAVLATVNMFSDKESTVLQIEAKHGNSGICIDAVKEIGQAVIEMLSDYRFKQVSLEKAHHERLLLSLDELIAEYLLSRDKEITAILGEDPVYQRILEEKAEYLVALKHLTFNLGELAAHPAAESDLWVDGQDEIARPVTVNKRLYLAAAFSLGLALSLLIVFIRHYFTTGKGEC
jgi:capsular polysaccharide biosynthesis protein